MLFARKIQYFARRINSKFISGEVKREMPDKQKQRDLIPVMGYGQYQQARKLVHECCNYDNGQCIALDEGDGCVCVQSISRPLLCRWFRCAVLLLDRELEAALFHRLERKKCSVCARLFLPGSNRAKYCPDCAARMKRKHAAERKRKQRRICHAYYET